MAALGGEGKSPFSSSSSDCDYFLRSLVPPPSKKKGKETRGGRGAEELMFPFLFLNTRLSQWPPPLSLPLSPCYRRSKAPFPGPSAGTEKSLLQYDQNIIWFAFPLFCRVPLCTVLFFSCQGKNSLLCNIANVPLGSPISPKGNEEKEGRRRM